MISSSRGSVRGTGSRELSPKLVMARVTSRRRDPKVLQWSSSLMNHAPLDRLTSSSHGMTWRQNADYEQKGANLSPLNSLQRIGNLGVRVV
jgi:hypothetical protein